MDDDLIGFVGIVGLFAGLLALILNAFIAMAVFRDGHRLQDSGSRLFLIGPRLWALLVFFTSAAGLAVYWLSHYSTLIASKTDRTL